VPLATSSDGESLGGVTASGRVIFRRTIGGTQNDLFSVNADGTGLVPLATSSDNEVFAGVF